MAFAVAFTAALAAPFFSISVRDGEVVGDVEKERKSRCKEASGVDLMGLFDKVKRSKRVCKPQIGKTKDVKFVEGGKPHWRRWESSRVIAQTKCSWQLSRSWWTMLTNL